MRIGLRLFFAFFVITGLTAFFLLRVFMAEVQPSVREVMEDLMVDTANLVAERSRDELAALAPGGDLRGGPLAAELRRYATRSVDAQIWGLKKTTLDLRVLVTDDKGRVVLDTLEPGSVGQDFSKWNDVLRSLRSEYGARLSREVQSDDRSGVMFVAAPVRDAQGRLLGVVSVAKPLLAVEGFIGRAQRRIFWAGVLLLALSLAIGVAVTLWLVFSVRKLRDYARRVQLDRHEPAPQVPGELGELAHAMEAMRLRLDGREHIEHTVRALTHELKSPLAAIRGAGELLQEPLGEDDRRRFAAQVVEQGERLRELVDRMLELSKLEMREGPAHPQRLRFDELVDEVLAAQPHGLSVQWRAREPLALVADRELLALACSNLLGNAIGFAPAGSVLELSLQASPAGMAVFRLRDHGPGVPPAAWPHLGERFFSTARPGTATKGSGLGLAIVRRVAELHGGALRFEPAEPGLVAILELPLA
ncbi:two-component system sensor histidine kinase CreC [Pelomonas sp. KK5]|uniref:two-component system sensor histidine kinase CreC n=1 Tax=Pelomonas sp. KK5 TaxID=1855730 RepID=UPI00097C940D|nr:two-component system sensor histidine kinase CreC [Pelomonas sp. KK5]